MTEQPKQSSFKIGFGQGDLVEPITMTVEEMLSIDPRIHVPTHMLKDIYIMIPMYIQIGLVNGQTVTIHKKAEGTLIKTDGTSDGIPNLSGIIKISDE